MINANMIKAKYGIETINTLNACFAEGLFSNFTLSAMSLNPAIKATIRNTGPPTPTIGNKREKATVTPLKASTNFDA